MRVSFRPPPLSPIGVPIQAWTPRIPFVAPPQAALPPPSPEGQGQGQGQGVSRSPEKAAPRVTQALSSRRGQMRSLTTARPHERDREKRKNKASANLLFWALCKLAPFPAYHPPLNEAELRAALPQLGGVFTGC